MKALIRVGAVLIALVMLGGCSWFQELFEGEVQKFSVDPAVTIQGSNALPVVDLDTFPKGASGAPYYTNPAADGKMRNALQDAIIARSLFTCSDFRKQLFARHLVRKIGFQTLALGLTGAATAVGGEAAKTVLSAAATGILGLDGTIDAHALQRNAITAILNTITSERTQLITEIRGKQGRKIGKYSMGAAVGDAIRYNKACSLTEAISVLGTAVEKKNANAETIKTLNISLKKLELQRAVDEAGAASKDSTAPKVVKDAANSNVTRILSELETLLGK